MYIILAHKKYSKCSYVHDAIGQVKLGEAGVSDQDLPLVSLCAAAWDKGEDHFKGAFLETCLYRPPPGAGKRQESETGLLGKQ